MRINNYEKIDKFFKSNGFSPEASYTISQLGLDDLNLIKKMKNNLSHTENRKKILNIYFAHSFLYIKDISKAFGLEIENKHLLGNINQIIVVADILLDYDKKELDDIIKLNYEWDLNNDESLGNLLNDDSIIFFKKRIKELEIKSVFFSGDEFKKEMKIPVSNWLIAELIKSGFIQKIYDELPELIMEIVDDFIQ